MKGTIQITIPSADEQVKEQLVAQLSAIGFDAFEERPGELVAFIETEKFEKAMLENVLSVYKLDYDETVVEEQNWNALWESNFAPVVVDNFCVIRAHFHPPFPDTSHEIIITPKMSFGTGHHATTYMMISEMRKLDFLNKTVADFGTGTGVLAILAEKLGSKFVWAIDNDDWSIENASENLEKNDCKRIVIEKTDGFKSKEKFDIILANINKNVIIANADLLCAGLTSCGKILLSGLLKEDEYDIVTAFTAKGFKHLSTVEKDKWICLLLQSGLNCK
jgi:ribosomal protein L11 methyltransferase